MLGSQHWIEGSIRGDQRKVRWLPIANRESFGIRIGVTESKQWVVETSDGLAELADGKPLIAVLRILELAPKNFNDRLRSALEDNGFEFEFARSFPIEAILSYSFGHGEYWVGHALDWIESNEIQFSSYATIRLKLEEVQREKSFSQQLRHRAKRVAFRITTAGK